ncbi:N-acetylglucosamine kinase [Zobellella endophytica]|uniref:N-acetylglucosamine kinase n=1 Tax=Zobellella endophytica TaxID=2116700 RepID=A0A2P7R6C7_9GAMM|nr:ROK family protein [Zobellella endophytica]PSJ45775.1 N-acetylglucosamine kinase [Zobellella endophytica]
MYYGFDIGGSKIAFAVFDDEFNERERSLHPTPARDYPAFLTLLLTLVRQADARWGGAGTVGLGFPGVLDVRGRILAPNVPAIDGRDLLGDLRPQLDRPLCADNDANCFLLSEYHRGAVAGAGLALGLTLGTGVGGGLIHDGRLINSRRGGCGEFGHGGINASLLRRYPELPLYECGCGLPGCLETYVSGTGLSRLYRHCGGQERDGKGVIAAWQQGEAQAGHCMSLYLDILAAGVGAMMTQLDPDAVVLGGGLSEYPWLYRELGTRLPEYLMAGVSAAPVIAPVFGGAGGVRGAALLARHASLPFS